MCQIEWALEWFDESSVISLALMSFAYLRIIFVSFPIRLPVSKSAISRVTGNVDVDESMLSAISVQHEPTYSILIAEELQNKSRTVSWAMKQEPGSYSFKSIASFCT